MSGYLENISIQPSNTISTGVIASNSGNNIIEFIIPESNRMIVPGSLRIVGDIQIFKDSASPPAIPTATDTVNISPKLGVHSIIDSVHLSSQVNKNTIENVRNYGRMLASMLPNTGSKYEAMGALSATSGMLPNILGQRLSFVNNVNNGAYSGNSFSIGLYTGLLMGNEPIPLSSEGWGIGGLNIAINIADTSMVLYAPDNVNAFYQLSNVNLVCELMTPSTDQLSRLMSQTSATLEYNAFNSFYQSIASTNAIINFNIATPRALSFFANFIPSTYLNSLDYNSFNTLPLINDLSSGQIAPIKQIVVTRGGEKVAIGYNLNTNVRTNASSVTADPNLVRNLMNSFGTNFDDIRLTQVSPVTNNRIGLNATQINEFADGAMTFGIGFALDDISGQGVDFRRKALTIALETGLESGLSHGVFLYVLSKQTLIMSASGLQVV